MSTLPLSPEAPNVILVGTDDSIDHELKRYGIPTDPGNVEPTLTVSRVRSVAEAKALVATVPPPTRKWAWTRKATFDPDNAVQIDIVMQAYFGDDQTVASALRMMNNEFSIHPSRLNG